MYDFHAFVYDQVGAAVNFATGAVDEQQSAAPYDPNVVSCVFVDPTGRNAAAHMKVYDKLVGTAKMVIMENINLIEAVMGSTADRKYMPCAKDGRGVDIFFKHYESVFTIVIGIDVSPMVFEKSEFVAHVTKTQMAHEIETHSIVYQARCNTSEGQAYMTVYERK